jgi:hypothetical protein
MLLSWQTQIVTATLLHVTPHTCGRSIALHQVGLQRCHCALASISQRLRGVIYLSVRLLVKICAHSCSKSVVCTTSWSRIDSTKAARARAKARWSGFRIQFNISWPTTTLPTEIGRCTSLQEITVISNGLSGTIPSELGELTSLEILDMGDNDFEGTLPLGICDLRDGNLTLLSIDTRVTYFACSCCSE